MSILSDLYNSISGKSAAETAQQAAADTYAKQLAASQQLQSAGGQYAQNVGGLAGAYDPYRNAGTSALQRLTAGLGLGGPGGYQSFVESYRASPGYQSGLETAMRAQERQANASGMGQSGRALLAAGRRASDYENERVGDYFSRLMGLSDRGYGATGAATGLQERGYAGQLGAQTGAANQLFGGAGTIGEGMVAGEKAKQAGLENLLGTAAFLGGSVLGGKIAPIGGAFGGGAKQPSYFQPGGYGFMG